MTKFYLYPLLFAMLCTLCSPLRIIKDTSENQTPAASSGIELAAPSAILMEANTGTILYVKNSHEKMRPASITKIMTLDLIFEALANGQIHKEDEVTVSEHAASMGGSQVYLEVGETQTVDTMIKCISICSANDACVAMAEYIDGTEDAFVIHMNEKAASLGMKDTTFVNCCGLEVDGHVTSAYDIALMSRELSVKHPEIHDYCTVWMDTITHKTRKGESEFGLTNTNKLLRQYRYCTGLKTGFTSQAKFCLSATATRDNVDLIAVVMAEEDSKIRNKEAASLLDYGFAHCQVYSDPLSDPLPDLKVDRGVEELVPIHYASPFEYVITDGTSTDAITKELHLPESVSAPLKENDVIGSVEYSCNGKPIGSVDILAAEAVPSATLKDYFLDCLLLLLLN